MAFDTQRDHGLRLDQLRNRRVKRLCDERVLPEPNFQALHQEQNLEILLRMACQTPQSFA